ncbi:MAG: Cna B-type domain-containing protein, partial [Clostridia bacterium]|nr:Cna B-type domain-containing protein [Clostridia bacterium]
EEAVEGYDTSIDGFNIKNTHKPEITLVNGEKTWDDADNQDGIRPESITVNLLANGKKIKSVTATAKDNWKYSFTNLPKFEAGKEIVYTITEEAVEGYDTSIDGFNIVNTHKPETTLVNGKKTWNDADNQDGIRPESITVNLLANGKQIKSVTVSAKDNWKYSFTNLPKFEAGKEIVYTITEDSIEGYVTEVNGFDLTNTHKPNVPPKEPEKTKTPTIGDLPKTGDYNNINMMLIMMVCSISLLLAGIYLKKKENKF